jgi:hypothetical protein
MISERYMPFCCGDSFSESICSPLLFDLSNYNNNNNNNSVNLLKCLTTAERPIACRHWEKEKYESMNRHKRKFIKTIILITKRQNYYRRSEEK